MIKSSLKCTWRKHLFSTKHNGGKGLAVHFNLTEIHLNPNTCADPEGERTGGPEPPEKSQEYRVSQQYLSESRENHKAFKSAFIVGRS